MPGKKSKGADMAATEPGASILEARADVGSKAAPGSSTRASRAGRKSAGKRGSTGKPKAARKTAPASTAELAEVCAAELIAPDQTVAKGVVGAARAGRLFLAETSIRERIALLAYSYWETRGCRGGSPEEDWFRAERELLENPALLEE